MTQPTTLYSFYKFQVVSGKIPTNAQLKLVNRSGEQTYLDQILKIENAAILKRLPGLGTAANVKRIFNLLVYGGRYVKPLKVSFTADNGFENAQGSFNGTCERTIILMRGGFLNLFVFKNPAALDRALSQPDYWPYTTNKKKFSYPSYPVEEWPYQKFLTNEPGIINDMTQLTNNAVHVL